MNYLIRYKNWLTLLLLLSIFKVSAQDISYKSFHDSQFGRHLLAFDTEREVLLRLDYEGQPLAGRELKVYSGAGEFITSGRTDKGGLFILPNRAYKELEVRVEGSPSPHRVKLHGITQQRYRLFAIYNSKNEGVLRISGLLQRGTAGELPEQLTLDIYDSNDHFIGSKKIKVRTTGYFETDLNRRGFNLQSYNLLFRVNGQPVKGYRLYQNSLEFAPFGNDNKSSAVKAELSTIFPGEPLRLKLTEPVDKIESLSYSFEEGEGFQRSFIYEGELGPNLTLNLPARRGPPLEEVTLRIELLYKDSTSRVERLKLTRINRLERALLIEQSVESHDGYLEIFSPFTAAEAFIINYSRTGRTVKSQPLKMGDNRVNLSAGALPFSKSLITIWDRESGRRLSYHFNITNRQYIKEGLTGNPIKEGHSYRLERAKPNSLPLFIYSTPVAESLPNSLLQSLENFNDFNGTGEELSPLCPGEALFTLWGIMKPRIPAALPGIERLSHFTGEHYYSEEIAWWGQQRFETSCLLPAELSEGDVAQLRLNITNRGRDRHKLNLSLFAGEHQLSTRNLTIEPYGEEELYLKAPTLKEEGTEEFILLVKEGETLRALHRMKVEIRSKKSFNVYTQLSGHITHNRETKLFMELPADRDSDYHLALYLSTRPVERALYRNSIADNIDNIEVESFEVALLSYLKEQLHQAITNREASSSPLSPFYSRGEGMGKPEQTALFLYAVSGGKAIAQGQYKTILTNLLTKGRQELLASPVSLFLLAELGLYLEEITPGYLNSLEQGRPLFYRYYSRLLPGKEQEALNSPLGEVYYGNYLLGDDFKETIEIILGLKEEDHYSRNYSHRLLEDCLVTAYVLKKLGKGEYSMNSREKTELRFKSKLLGDFKAVLQGRSLISRDFTLLKGAELEDKEQLIELSFTKEGPAELSYLLESSYKREEPVREESATLKTALFWSDGSGKKLSQEGLRLEAGESYYLNIVIESSTELKELFFVSPSCSGLSFDYEEAMFNKDMIERGGSDRSYLRLTGLKQGRNRLIIPVTARHRGSYRLAGARLFDIYRLDNFLKLAGHMIVID